MSKATHRIQATKGPRRSGTGRLPTFGKAKPIADWKFERLRDAILQVVPADEDGIPFTQLPGLVRQSLQDEDAREIGSIGWHTTQVKLELEARGELRRVAGSKPQRLRRIPKS